MPVEQQRLALQRLVRRLDRAVEAASAEQIAQRVKAALHELADRPSGWLTEELQRPGDEDYARRLLHRDPSGRYTVIVMTWGPRQSTPLHDHAGLWCVECVTRGTLDVTQYELLESSGPRYRFARGATVRARVGDAGCLIPPFEHHVMANPDLERTSVTVHVYGGEMRRCRAYEPCADGWWLGYDRPLACLDATSWARAPSRRRDAAPAGRGTSAQLD